MIRVVVTGAGGFIGHHLVRRLVSDGYRTRGVELHAPEYEPTPAHEFRALHLRRPDDAAATDGNDLVYHLAADMQFARNWRAKTCGRPGPRRGNRCLHYEMDPFKNR